MKGSDLWISGSSCRARKGTVTEASVEANKPSLLLPIDTAVM